MSFCLRASGGSGRGPQEQGFFRSVSLLLCALETVEETDHEAEGNFWSI